ncbi:class D beta-lactamase [Lachnoclostridium sp. An131]|nr:class D beta-lactamase [Lachnoclostridium sp. An131]
MAAFLAVCGCGEKEKSVTEAQNPDTAVQAEIQTEKVLEEPQEAEEIPEKEPLQEKEEIPVTEETDWSGYFDGLNGAAVLYWPSENRYQIYNAELAQTRRSPCSTFKIISSLVALENGILEPENSVRTWSGEAFWNEDWNRDIGFEDAFHTSCVWYFRQLADDIGPELMQQELDRLQYGNCDISDWEGRLNTNNSNRALTGFWIESSLKISPKEQMEVMERIFGRDSEYSAETQQDLMDVMLVTEQNDSAAAVYGKTGMGKDRGITVDAWFTGFADTADGRVCFCVYLGETEGREVTSTGAREIALKLLADYE